MTRHHYRVREDGDEFVVQEHQDFPLNSWVEVARRKTADGAMNKRQALIEAENDRLGVTPDAEE